MRAVGVAALIVAVVELGWCALLVRTNNTPSPLTAEQAWVQMETTWVVLFGIVATPILAGVLLWARWASGEARRDMHGVLAERRRERALRRAERHQRRNRAGADR